jgi:hypothetical protein
VDHSVHAFESVFGKLVTINQVQGEIKNSGIAVPEDWSWASSDNYMTVIMLLRLFLNCSTYYCPVG